MTGIDFLTLCTTHYCSSLSYLGWEAGRDYSALSDTLSYTLVPVWWRRGTRPVATPPSVIPLGLPATVTLKMLSLSWHWPQTNTWQDAPSCRVTVVMQGPHTCTNVKHFPLCCLPAFRQLVASAGGLLPLWLSHNQSVWTTVWCRHSKQYLNTFF